MYILYYIIYYIIHISYYTYTGDDDLLEILGQAKNPTVIQSHLKKLFQGIYKVKFNDNNSKIIAMISSANEVVDFITPVVVNDKVEVWLEDLACEMRATLSTLLIKAISTYNTTKTIDWKYPSQIICLMNMILFTTDAEKAIDSGTGSGAGHGGGGSGGLVHLSQQLQAQLRDLTAHDLGSSEPLLQLKIKSLVFDMVRT